MANSRLANRPWFFSEEIIDSFMDEGSDALALALASLYEECTIYVINDSDGDAINYVCKFSRNMSKYPYVDIHGAWTETALLQFWRRAGYTNINLVEETPEGVTPADVREMMPHAKKIMKLLKHYQKEDSLEDRVNADKKNGNTFNL